VEQRLVEVLGHADVVGVNGPCAHRLARILEAFASIVCRTAPNAASVG
jgi:hypothetical protein